MLFHSIDCNSPATEQAQNDDVEDDSIADKGDGWDDDDDIDVDVDADDDDLGGPIDLSRPSARPEPVSANQGEPRPIKRAHTLPCCEQ